MKIPSLVRNNLWFLFFILFSGCESRVQNISDLPPPPPPPNFIPTFPSDFISELLTDSRVQINPIPHPLSLDGEIPFAVWLNGERLELSNSQIKDLTQFLDIKYEKPKDTFEIHSGAGWLKPLPLKNLTANE